ncbi:hypothetical protein ACHAW6_011946 [Cyclotella cf. meneghiniana]
MADDEFEDDNIDWTAVDLPYVSRSVVERQQQGRGGYQNAYTTGNHTVNTTGYRFSTASSGIKNRVQTTYPHSESNEASLLRQIKQLQDQLEAKSDQIFELEATAATSAVESIALVQRAEEDARNRVHLIEEELRRVKREADQYKGQWVRVKKRVAELEAGISGGGVGNDCESSRAITPSSADPRFHNHFGEHVATMGEEKSKSPGVKRKFQSDQDTENCQEKKESASFITRPPAAHKYDSVRQRLIKHLLLRDEMGCYVLENNIKHLARSPEVNGQDNKVPLSQSASEGNCERKHEMILGDDVDKHYFIKCSAQKIALQVEQGTVSHVKSILCHMLVGASVPPDEYTHNIHGAMSISGLVRVLLERFNSLFVDYLANGQTQESMEVANQSFDKKDHRMVLVLYSDGNAEAKATYATHSWRAVLYILHVLQDIILLSGKTRDDLRWWFYRSRHSVRSRSTTDDSGIPAIETIPESQINTRIEGLPSQNTDQDLLTHDRKEALWSACCLSVTNTDDGWDASTMALPVNKFYEIIVGLMKGHLYPSQDNCFPLETEKEIAQYAQVKSIEFVLRLMSDAAPYDHGDVNCSRKTPYLWKFWFDSLFPMYSITSGLAPDSSVIGDFFSLWETSGGNYREKLIGSGRRYHTQRPTNTAGFDVQPINLIGDKQSSKSDKSKTRTLSVELTELERIVIDTKIKSLQLICHFILSSSSVHQSMYKIPSSFAKRVLFGVLDELDEFVIPCILSRNTLNQGMQDLGRCLDLCYSCMVFILVLSRSDAGLHLLRIQTRLDFQIGGRSRWSSSAIACVSTLLDNVLSCVAEFEDEDTTASVNAEHAPLLKRIVELCILFFTNLLAFVHSQQVGRDSLKSQAPSLKSFIDEEYNIFLSCCQKVLSLKMFRDQLKYETCLLLEEILLDDQQ